MFSLVNTAYAQHPGEGGVDLGKFLRLSNDQAVGDIYTEPAFLVNLIVQNVFIIGAIILFILIFYAGFKFVAQGKEGIQDAKKIMTTAIVGFLIMFCAYWIVQIVGVLTGIDVSLGTP